MLRQFLYLNEYIQPNLIGCTSDLTFLNLRSKSIKTLDIHIPISYIKLRPKKIHYLRQMSDGEINKIKV